MTSGGSQLSAAKPLPIGVVVFTDPRSCQFGWAAGDWGYRPVRGLNELQEGVVWWTNASPEALAELPEGRRRSVVILPDNYFGVPQSLVLSDLVGAFPPHLLEFQRLLDLRDFFRAVIARVWSFCKDAPSVQNRPFRLIGATLADDMTRVTTGIQLLPANELGLIEAAKSKRRPVLVAFPRDTDQPMVLRRSRRLDHARESAQTLCASGNWRLLSADELIELQAAGFPPGKAPFVLEVTVSGGDEFSEFFGVLGPRSVQVCLTALELALAIRLFDKLEVHRGWIATTYCLPAAVLDFAGSVEPPSGALQELADTFVLDAYRSAMARSLPARTIWSPGPACFPGLPSWNGFLLDASDRVNQLLRVFKLHEKGCRILSYDGAQIVINDPGSQSLDEIRRDFDLVASR